MRKTIITLILLVSVSATFSQDCVKFVKAKWVKETFTSSKAYDAKDYEWKLTQPAKEPVIAPIYETVVIKDAFTGIDSAELKRSGKICTITTPEQKKVVIRGFTTITPATPPVYAWLPKEGFVLTIQFTKDRNLKDGYLTISNCE